MALLVARPGRHDGLHDRQPGNLPLVRPKDRPENLGADELWARFDDARCHTERARSRALDAAGADDDVEVYKAAFWLAEAWK